jgi:hypothetical protein
MLRLLALGLTLTTGGIGGWVWWSPKSEDPAAVRAEQFAANGEEGAEARWRTNQPRHWRYIVIGKRQ